MEEITKLCSCEKHGEYIARITNVLGLEIVQACTICTLEERELDKEREAKAKQQFKMQRIALEIEKANLPKKYSTLKDFEFKASQEAIKDYKYNSNLILYGTTGSGKTMIASYLALKAIYNGKTVRYLYASDIEKKAKESWGTKYNEDDMLAPYINCDILILDEIGRVQYNDYLFKVLDSRYLDEKITILLGNVNVKEIPKILGEAIASRLRENVQAISLGTEDYRTPAIF